MIQVVRPTESFIPEMVRFFAAIDRTEIRENFSPHAFSEEQARRICMHRGQDEYRVAVWNEQIVAYGMLRGWDEGFPIPSLGICVHPAFVGRGIGESLVQYLISIAKDRRASEIILKVKKTNVSAIRLYEKTGFKLSEYDAQFFRGVLKLPTDMDRRHDVTILLATINECENLKRLLPILKEVFRSVDYDILVIDGHSTDSTVEVAKSHGCRVQTQKEKGYAAAILQGIQARAGRYLIVMDADGSHTSEDAFQLYQNRALADIVINSRYVKGGKSETAFFRQALSWMLNVMYRIGLRLPFQEISGGFRIYRSDVLDSFRCSSHYYEIQEELLIIPHWLGYSAAEIPYVYKNRDQGHSKAKIIAYGVKLVQAILRLRRRKTFLMPLCPRSSEDVVTVPASQRRA